MCGDGSGLWQSLVSVVVIVVVAGLYFGVACLETDTEFANLIIVHQRTPPAELPLQNYSERMSE